MVETRLVILRPPPEEGPTTKFPYHQFCLPLKLRQRHGQFLGRLTLRRSGRAAVRWPGASAPRASQVQVTVWSARGAARRSAKERYAV